MAIEKPWSGPDADPPAVFNPRIQVAIGDSGDVRVYVNNGRGPEEVTLRCTRVILLPSGLAIVDLLELDEQGNRAFRADENGGAPQLNGRTVRGRLGPA